MFTFPEKPPRLVRLIVEELDKPCLAVREVDSQPD
jgi:hypothetical protein